MSLAALNIPRALMLAWAAIASLGIAAIAVYHANTLGNLREAQADLREAWRVNDSAAKTLDTLRDDLGLCERQFASVQKTAEADRLAHQIEIQALRNRLQETRNDISDNLQAAADADPALAACLALPVPGATYDSLRAAADRAAGAGASGSAQVDPGAGKPDQPAGCAGAPDHAEGMSC